MREKRHKGVEKGDKVFLESPYYTKERVTMQLPMEERKVGDERQVVALGEQGRANPVCGLDKR